MKRRGNGRFVLPLLLALLSALLIVFLVFTVIADDLPGPDETPPDFTDFSKVSERSVPSEQPSGAVSASEASESASSSDGYTDPYADDGEVHEIVLSFVGDCTLASSQHHKGSAYAFETVMDGDFAYPFAKTAQFSRQPPAKL